MKKRFIRELTILVAVILVIMPMTFLSASASAVSAYDADDGVVEIITGLSGGNDSFYPLKSTSGFIVSNSEDGCYIISGYEDTVLLSKEKDDFFEEKGVSEESYSYSEAVKVVVNGDVKANLNTVAESRKENFRIFSSDSVMNERSALKLGSDAYNGESVYALGFSKKNAGSSQFNSEDVERYAATVLDSEVSKNDTFYIALDIDSPEGFCGGPLVDEYGYVVGMNLSDSDENDAAYALPIARIRLILDNYSVNYESKELSAIREEFLLLYNNLLAESESDTYQKDSKQTLKETLDTYSESWASEADESELTDALAALNEAKGILKEKTPFTTIMIYILSISLVLLAVPTVYLLIVNRRDIKRRNEEGQASQSENESINSTSEKVTGSYGFLSKPHSNMMVRIDKSEFVIGSGEYTDYRINNRAVSRIHATIRNSDGCFYLSDNNSANGTYINDVLLEATETLLHNGDVITFANEVYIFEQL